MTRITRKRMKMKMKMKMINQNVKDKPFSHQSNELFSKDDSVSFFVRDQG